MSSAFSLGPSQSSDATDLCSNNIWTNHLRQRRNLNDSFTAIIRVHAIFLLKKTTPSCNKVNISIKRPPNSQITVQWSSFFSASRCIIAHYRQLGTWRHWLLDSGIYSRQSEQWTLSLTHKIRSININDGKKNSITRVPHSFPQTLITGNIFSNNLARQNYIPFIIFFQLTSSNRVRFWQIQLLVP